MRKSATLRLLLLGTIAATAIGGLTLPASGQPVPMYVDVYDLVPGSPLIYTQYDTRNYLDIRSTTRGETTPAGMKRVVMGLQIPLGYDLTGVRVCYAVNLRTSVGAEPTSFISQIRLAQLTTPPGAALVKHDERLEPGSNPICIDSFLRSPPFRIDPLLGAIELSLRVNFGRIEDVITVSMVGLYLLRGAR